MFWKLVIIAIAVSAILKWTPRDVDDVILFGIIVVASIAIYVIMNIFEGWLHRCDDKTMEKARKKAGLGMRFKL